MQEVIVEIKIIEGHFSRADHRRAYQALSSLCLENTSCGVFSPDASGILSRYNDLENHIINGLLNLTEQQIKKNEISQSYVLLLQRIKAEFQDIPISCYEDQEMRIKEQRDMLFKSLMTVENDLYECENPEKSDLLLQIKQQIKDLMIYFKELMKSFRAVKNYE